MSKLKTLPEVARFASILRQSELDSRCADQAVERVAYLVSDFESRLENRAGNRVRRSIRAEVRKTVGHLTTAARNTDDDSPTRNDARKLIRFAGGAVVILSNFNIGPLLTEDAPQQHSPPFE